MSSANSNSLTSPICQPKEWEKIITNDASGKGLVSKIYNQFMQLKIKTNKQLNKKIGQRPKETFSPKMNTDGQEALGKNTPTLPGCRQILHHLSHLGSPY